MKNSKIEMIAVGKLVPWAKNARTHSKKQIRQIADSIKAFGFTNPVLTDNDNTILAGHGRVEAAKLLEMDQVPCLRLKHMTPAQKRAYVLADNKLALNAGWDEGILAKELEVLLSIDLDFDVQLTGFSIAEIDMVIDTANPEEPNDPDDDILPACIGELTQCYAGDIWQLGPHKLICGDALDKKVVSALMGDKLARMVFTDPPYNIVIDGNVSNIGGTGSIKHREFAMASGEMSSAEFTAFLKCSFENLCAYAHGGSIHFICMDWRHLPEIIEAGNDVYSELKNMIVWVKDNGGMGSFYRSRHELIFAFKHGTETHTNTFDLGQHGRYRTNVWEYKGMNSRQTGRLEELALHPTVKPVQMIADAIKDVSGRGDIVLDLFGGSGSTMIAAHKTGRRAYLAEIDPIYCATIIKRWETFAHDDAKLLYRIASEGETRAGAAQ